MNGKMYTFFFTGFDANPIPISVNGGYYKKFYLSGIYSPGATVNSDDAECYISSGKFAEELAGAGQQQIAGNVKWQIYNADIENFFGGGINAEKPITGNIEVNIFNSKVSWPFLTSFVILH